MSASHRLCSTSVVSARVCGDEAAGTAVTFRDCEAPHRVARLLANTPRVVQGPMVVGGKYKVAGGGDGGAVLMDRGCSGRCASGLPSYQEHEMSVDKDRATLQRPEQGRRRCGYGAL